jgi:hypothetical protein
MIGKVDAELDQDPCPLCGRALIPGRSVNKHHLIPRSKGGREAFPIHTICHSKIHSVWTRAQLRDEFHTWESIRADPRITAFVRWVRKRRPDFVGRNARPRDRS